MDSQVTNEISGTVHGHVVQARDIENVHIHPPARALEAPRQLPPPPVAFVNRDIEVERVDRIVNQRHASGSTPVVVLTGGHGVGKTATSRYWAQTHGKQFGDGHLYADFQQVAYGGGPAVGDVVGGFLSAFGIPNEVIPPGLAERAALFRSSTAGKRVLVLLDDVGQAAQVQPLIPNSVDAVVLVTSRSPLEELVTDGAGLIRLRPLDHGSARALLAGMIGEERLDAEPAAVVRLVEICGGLPVALRICGARLAAHEERPVRWLVEELADEAARLERLGVTRERSLRVVFDDAYRALGVVEALVYRRLGLHPGLSFTHSVAAAASGLEHGQVGGPLERLVEAHLVIEERAGRFRFHDLLRVHARRVAESEESEEEQERVVRRIVEYYVAGAKRMDRALIPIRLRLADSPPSSGGESAPASPSEALAWFEAERQNLVAALRLACESGWDAEAWHLGEALFVAYHNHKHYEEALEVYRLAAEGASRCGYPEAEARLRAQLARAYIDIGQFAEADLELATCRRLLAGSDNRALIASVGELTGVFYIARGEYEAAIATLEDARRSFEALGDVRGRALQEYHLGRAFDASGEHLRAVECLLRARELVDPDRDGLTLGRILLRLGEAYRSAGEAESAKTALGQALGVMRRNDAPFYEALAQEALAPLEQQAGNPLAAREHLSSALSIYASLRSPRAQLVQAQLDQTGPEAPSA